MRRPETTSFARQLRRETTSAEALLWRQLRARRTGDLKFVRQQPIGPYYADFLCREEKLIVEIDGATHSTAAEVRHDERRSEYLRSLGYRLSGSRTATSTKISKASFRRSNAP